MTSVSTAGQIADALLADAEFRALRLGTWLAPHLVNSSRRQSHR